ncbi:hypothetical protein RTP6_007212 [Batrachochytrium dendrobatidis]
MADERVETVKLAETTESVKLTEPAKPMTIEYTQSKQDTHSVAVPILPINHKLPLDGLGPVIVNTDGTLGRITNWTLLSAHEQANTLRIISLRNQRRLKNLNE